MKCLTIWGIVLLAAQVLNAQVSITGGPFVDAITHSTARFYWATNVVSSTRIHYGQTQSYGTIVDGAPATQNQKYHAWFLSGLAPSTTYHAKVCSTADAVETCSANLQFTTSALPPGKHPVEAELPRMDVDITMPVQTGETLMVGADCNDANTGLVARWQQAAWGDTVVIPVTTTCTGSFKFPVKAPDAQVPHRWIVTRSGAPDNELPPPGTRVTPDIAARMPQIRANITNLAAGPLESRNLYHKCWAGSYFWAWDQPGFAMSKCINGSSVAIVATSAQGTSPLEITAPGHGLATGDVVWVSGVQGNTAANGSYTVTVLDANRLQLNFPAYGSPTSNGFYAGGGAISKNVWVPVAHQQGTTVPSTCTVGDWFWKSDVTVAQEGVYRCVATNTFARMPAYNLGGFETNPTINLSTNGAHHLRFIGLQLTHVPLPPEPLWAQSNGLQSGSAYGAFVHQNASNSYIVWDRCWFRGEEPARIQIGGFFDGSHIAVIDSYFSGLQIWQGNYPRPQDWESGAIIFHEGPGPGRVQNNHLEAYGITLYSPDDGNSVTTAPADYVIRDNYFLRSDTYLLGSRVSNGRTYMVRHPFELKRGFRWLVEGNVFDGNWGAVNNAAAIALSPRPGPGTFISSISGGVVTTTARNDITAGSRVLIVNSGNAAVDGYWQVAERLSSTRFRLTGAASLNAGPAIVNRLDSAETIADVTIRNNIFQRVNTGIFMIGHTEGGSYATVQNPVQARVKIVNNLFTKMDTQRTLPNGSFPNGAGGSLFYAAWGVQDVELRHNTMAGNGANIVPIALELSSLTNPGEGFAVTDNVWVEPNSGSTVAMSGTYFGTDALNRAWKAGNNASWEFHHNVIARPSSGPPAFPHPGTNVWHNLGQSALPFENAANGVYRLTRTYLGSSNCYGSAGDCSTDGKDVGVDYSLLPGATGGTASVTAGNTQARVTYTAPTSSACAVEYAENSDFSSAVRLTDMGKTRNRSVELGALSPSTDYYVRVLCGTVINLGKIRTLNENGAINVQLALRPPAVLAANDVVVEYGSTAALGTSLPPETCAGTCLVAIPGTKGQSLYYRWTYRSAGATAPRSSSTHVLIP